MVVGEVKGLIYRGCGYWLVYHFLARGGVLVLEGWWFGYGVCVGWWKSVVEYFMIIFMC